MATDVQETHAFSAFEQQLKTLCLKEFPCGPGSWRQTPSADTKNKKKLNSNSKLEGKFSITLKDYGAQHEKTETLEEYVGSAKSPWSLDYSWSQEAKPLRELAVKSPWLIDDNFVLSYFKTLRIVNKNVTEVDSNLLKFQNLQELTLSCNLISKIDSTNLPSSLKVLEVCANEVSELSDLCIKPPSLIHLGLGYNRISLTGDYLTGQYWPALLSLDLSNNNLSDLLDVVQKVGTMPKLRNLVLQGNPLALIPGYRGYTVDSLRKLSVLDDIMISADERHYFKGLARRREYILDEAKVKLGVTYIKGIPIPDEVKNPEDQPEFPVIERKYFVQFMFLEDSTLKTEGLLMMNEDELADMAELSGFPSDRTDNTTQLAQLQTSGSEQQLVEKNVAFNQEPDVIATIDQSVPTEPSPEPEIAEKKTEEMEHEERTIRTAPIDSEKMLWAEELECNWTQSVVRDDLLSLRDFFKQGMQITVVEEMVEGHPPEATTPVGGKSAGKKDKKEKDDKAKSGGKEKGGDKKKKKGEPEQELKKGPPTFTTLATFHVPLAEFLEGEFSFDSVFTQGKVEIASTVKSVEVDSAKKDKKVDGKDKKKPPSAGKKKEDPKDKGKDRKGSAKGAKDSKGDKSGKGAKGAPVAGEEEEDAGPPPPLEIHVSVELHHWKTAMDLLKDEEERNKPPQPTEPSES